MFFCYVPQFSRIEVQGIVCMDCRSVGIAVDLAPFIPQGLWQSLVPQHVRLSPVAIDYVAPLVPRGHLSTRLLLKTRLAPWQDSYVSRRCSWQFADTDHYDLPSSHAWDMSRCIQRTTRRTRRRKRAPRVLDFFQMGLDTPPQRATTVWRVPCRLPVKVTSM